MIKFVFSSPGPAFGVCCASFDVRQQLKLTYSNIFFYKTTGPVAVKFHTVHELTQGSQNCKLGQVECPR